MFVASSRRSKHTVKRTYSHHFHVLQIRTHSCNVWYVDFLDYAVINIFLQLSYSQKQVRFNDLKQSCAGMLLLFAMHVTYVFILYLSTCFKLQYFYLNKARYQDETSTRQIRITPISPCIQLRTSFLLSYPCPYGSKSFN